jgi:uncharacterized SAM-binding protein YcdF (DUF218 family)
MSGLILSKLIGQLLLPPADLVLLGVIGMLTWRRWWGKSLVILSFSLLWLLSTEPVRDGLIAPLEDDYPPLAVNASLGSPATTAIVLFGGGIYAKAPEYGGVDALRMSALSRTVYAADLALRTGLSVYPSGGLPLTGKAEPEGSVMRRWLMRLGVPPEHIVMENAATTTWENASRLKELLQAHGIHRVVLVTSAWHMPRSVWSMRSQGMLVIPAPCDYRQERLPYGVLSYLPDQDVLSDSCQALHEYLGLLWYRIRYGALGL